jgi:uncharacterized membrane protein YkoI
MKPILALILAVTMLAAVPAQAHDHDRDDHERDHDRVRRSVLAGEILPLSTILDRVERDFGGELIEAEMESYHGRPVYEIKLIGGAGRMRKLLYDAADGTLLKSKER